MTLTDTAVGLLGLAVAVHVVEHVVDPHHKNSKKKEDKPFKW
jgi:hypothetical protein